MGNRGCERSAMGGSSKACKAQLLCPQLDQQDGKEEKGRKGEREREEEQIDTAGGEKNGRDIRGVRVGSPLLQHSRH